MDKNTIVVNKQFMNDITKELQLANKFISMLYKNDEKAYNNVLKELAKVDKDNQILKARKLKQKAIKKEAIALQEEKVMDEFAKFMVMFIDSKK